MIRRLLAATLCIGLAACSQSATNDASQPAASPQSMAQKTMLGGCTFPHFWAFHGSCAIGHIPAGGGSIVLPKYKGKTVTFGFGPNDATSPTPFVLADAVGTDISGKLNGTLSFPWYGSVPCVTPEGASAPCAGKAILYLLVVNTGAVPVKTTTAPSISIGGTGTLDGLKACTKSTLMWSGNRTKTASWIVRKVNAAMGDLKIQFPPLATPQAFANHGSFTIFAITCT